MQCEKFEQRLQTLLDRRLRPERDETLRAHASMCRICQKLLDHQAALFDGLRAFQPPPLTDEFAVRVLARGRADHSAPMPARRRWRSFWAVGVSVAATLVVSLVVWIGKNPAREIVAVEHGAAPAVPATPTPHPAWALMEPLWDRMPEIRSTGLGGVTGRLRPITASFTTALDALRRTIPGGRSRTDKPQAGRIADVDAARLS